MRRGETARRADASILVGLLWCVALLAVVVVGALYASRLDLRVVKNHGDQIQAHYLALAGIEQARALLYQDAADRRTSGRNHTGELFDAPHHFQDVVLGRGQFRVIRQGRREEGGGIIYGVTDEESRLNLNTASLNELVKLYGMTPQNAAALVDYRDPDSIVTPGGAEADEYAQFQPPYLPANAPFRTMREVLLVYGLSREFFLGEDVNQNSLLDPEENDDGDGVLDPGWAGLATVESSAQDVNARGEPRINIQSASERRLTSVPGLTTEIAKAMVAHRDRNRFESLADLLDVAAARPDQPRSQQSGQSSRGQNQPPANQQGAAPAGEKLINEELLMDIADYLTVNSEQNQPGAVNINTAQAGVLACLPGMTGELAIAITSYRQSAGFFDNIAWLLKVPGMNRQIFKQLAPRVTVRSETFRILSEGKVSSTGARKRLEVVVRVSSSNVETLSFREDDL